MANWSTLILLLIYVYVLNFTWANYYQTENCLDRMLRLNHIVILDLILLSLCNVDNFQVSYLATIRVSDVNDNDPKFLSTPYIVTLDEVGNLCYMYFFF